MQPSHVTLKLVVSRFIGWLRWNTESGCGAGRGVRWGVRMI